MPACTPQPQNVTALLAVLLSHPPKGRKLSWPEWLSNADVGCRPEDGRPSRYQPSPTNGNFVDAPNPVTATSNRHLVAVV